MCFIPNKADVKNTTTTLLTVSEVQVCLSDLLDVIVGELFQDLTEDLVFERLSLQRSLKDLVGELVDRTRPFGWVVTHVLHHRCSRGQGHQPAK